MTAPTFGPIPSNLWNEEPPKKEPSVRCNLRDFDQLLKSYRGYAHGSWGYTILRTVYTPESEVLFPAAIERLKRYVHYRCHYSRFTSYGALCEKFRIDFAEPNEEMSRRFYLDVVEDPKGLAHLDGDSPEKFIALGDYFCQWAASVDTGHYPDENPRFCNCLVINTESLVLLAQLPDELPPLRCAVDLKEKQDFLGTGYSAWLWLLETQYMAQPALHEDSYCGWLRVVPSDIKNLWFEHLNRSSNKLCLEHEERPQGSGIHYFG
jgi:hypothetical protein